MDTGKITKALAVMGLTEEQIDKWLARIAGVNRKAQPLGGATLAMKYRSGARASSTKAKSRKILVTYRPSQSAGRTVADELEALRARLERDNVPDWQRRRLQARLDALLRTGRTHGRLASETLDKVASEKPAQASRLVHRDAGSEAGLGKVAAATLASMGR
jgi:hypothetical protein